MYAITDTVICLLYKALIFRFSHYWVHKLQSETTKDTKSFANLYILNSSKQYGASMFTFWTSASYIMNNRLNELFQNTHLERTEISN